MEGSGKFKVPKHKQYNLEHPYFGIKGTLPFFDIQTGMFTAGDPGIYSFSINGTWDNEIHDKHHCDDNNHDKEHRVGGNRQMKLIRIRNAPNTNENAEIGQFHSIPHDHVPPHTDMSINPILTMEAGESVFVQVYWNDHGHGKHEHITFAVDFVIVKLGDLPKLVGPCK